MYLSMTPERLTHATNVSRRAPRWGRIGIVAFVAFMLARCAFYSFTDSNIPPHLKSISIPLFVNESLQPGVAEEITESLIEKVTGISSLRFVGGSGDATISGKVTGYSNDPHTYGSSGVRQVDVRQYAVHITIYAEFRDNIKEEQLFKGRIVGEGIYNFQNETEASGRRTAINDAVEQLMQNSLQGW
ncbi:MAG: hypothetical protein GF398_12055 [Chitinivibrionales bacterium]|nr:hypothetical protein [Chitinivibrionales bacterium]